MIPNKVATGSLKSLSRGRLPGKFPCCSSALGAQNRNKVTIECDPFCSFKAGNTAARGEKRVSLASCYNQSVVPDFLNLSVWFSFHRKCHVRGYHWSDAHCRLTGRNSRYSCNCSLHFRPMRWASTRFGSKNSIQAILCSSGNFLFSPTEGFSLFWGGVGFSRQQQ